MRAARRWAILGLLVFLAIVVVHSVTPWKWSAELQVPVGVRTVTAHYECGALWGSASVKGPTSTPYPLPGSPCGQRTQYQVLTALDASLAVFALAALGAWSIRRKDLTAGA